MILGFVAGGKVKDVPQLEPQERADILQWAESERAKLISDALATFAYGRGSENNLTPAQAQTSRRLAALALRSTKPEWVAAARKHAVQECAERISETVPFVVSHRDLAETLTAKVLEAYLGILDGSIVLPAESYLAISKDRVL